MTAVSIEVAADPTATDGGRALILLKGLASAPETVNFRIDPIDDALLSDDAEGWPSGERAPLEVRVLPDSVHLLVGADVVDAPLLQPGTPVTISIPSQNLKGELRWPNIPASTAPRRRPAVLTVAQLRAKQAPAAADVTYEVAASGAQARAAPLADGSKPALAELAGVRKPAATASVVDNEPRLRLADAVILEGETADASPPSMRTQLPAVIPPGPGATVRRRPRWGATIGFWTAASGIACALTALAWFGPGENLAEAVRRGVIGQSAPAFDAVFHSGPVSPRGRPAAHVDVDTALHLADASLHGEGQPVDRVEARYWLAKALELTLGDDGLKWALSQLASLYARPGEGPADFVTARALWTIAAAEGDAVALCSLAKVEEKGLGGPVDRPAALRHYEKSMSLGSCKEAVNSVEALRK